LLEEVITIRFHTKVTKGGRNLSVGVLVAVGNGKGKLGLGYGKARGVPAAIEKANKEAQANMVKVNLVGDTVAHEIFGEHGSARVLLKPASPGTGVKAGGTVRSIMQVAGVHNVLSKVYGPTNPINVAKATMNALTTMRSKAEIERLRGVEIELSHPQMNQPEEAEKEAEETKAQAEEQQEEFEVPVEADLDYDDGEDDE
jgi:small subunit ribosomal protein S5